MNALALHSWTLWSPVLALVASGFRLAVDREARGRWVMLIPLIVLLPLAAVVARPLGLENIHAPLVAALVVAILARDRGDQLQSECALKLAWVLGGSLALSWAGNELLALVAGTRVNAEQWAVLNLSVVPGDLWSVALPLSLLAGLVMLGGAPFHFWPADLFQGGRAWAAPLAAAALQITGVMWLSRRLEGIAALPEARSIATGLFTVSAGAALVVGAGTLMQQRRPERRVGTLASLQGALALGTMIAAGPGPPPTEWFERWAAHLAIALTGAALLARFLPVTADETGRGGVLFRRHPAAGIAGLVACFSLAGVPGTPGASLWLETARSLMATRHTGLAMLLALAWAVAFSTVMRQWREAAAIPEERPLPERSVPWRARAALWIAGVGVMALGLAWLIAR